MYLKRKWSVLLAVVLALGLSACGSKVPSSEVPGEPPVAGQQDQTPRDWREDAAITIRSTAAYSSETVNVCVCAEDESAYIYRDAPEQELLARADYPIYMENAEDTLTGCDFEDLDRDGNSELTMIFTLPENDRAIFIWFWIDGEGYVLNEEFSQLPGEGAGGDAAEHDNPAGQTTDTRIPEAYIHTLNLYATALDNQWNGGALMNQGLNYMAADCYGDAPLENIGYRIQDLDGDGNQELVIGTTETVTDDFYGKLILDLYTVGKNGEATQVFSGTERDRYYYAGGNKFASIGSSSSSDSFETTVKLEDGELIDMTQITDPDDYVQLALTPMSR